MVDTAPPKTEFTGPKNYYRGGHRYANGASVCDDCRYADNKTCGECMFARWNLDGVRLGLPPKEAHAKAHPEQVRDAIRGSPMMAKFSMDHVEHRAGQEKAVKTVSAERLARAVNDQLDKWGVKGLWIDASQIPQWLGRSPIENGSPAAGSLPMLPTDIPAVPHGTVDPVNHSTTPDPQDVNHVLGRLYEVRRVLDH